MSGVVEAGWARQAACAAADPDLFFPEPDSPTHLIEQAKEICAGCPVRKECLDDAMRRGEPDAICGGLTVVERQQLLRPDGTPAKGKASARQLAVKHGAFLAQSLGQYGASVERMASELGSTPVSVYLAYMLLVPRRPKTTRPTRPSRLETFLESRKEQLKTLERRGLSQSEIGDVLGVPQSMVAAALAILRQRHQVLERMAADGVGDPLRALRGHETRVRQEAGVGLTVDDVIHIAGKQILRMAGEGRPLRQVARDLDLNREGVRKAYQKLTSKQVVKVLHRDEMRTAA